ncbi:retinol dehydrogenase 11-like isoform X2 [Lycorma delicatula]|uniref:retinol dehydrogenase 11-like isoform X2 n=1 Tax=Lycorma delicatula TaxID=130591 RepID=UPI003F517D82
MKNKRMGILFNGKCTSKERLDGKTVIITGSNTGIGKYTALALYERGAQVIMACRNLEKAEEASKYIKEKIQNIEGRGELVIKHLDLSSLASVRNCAQELLQENQNIHILINNAGVMMSPRQITEDGYELQFATNHLGHFLFTLLLLPRILRSAPARIVNVSSIVHRIGDLYLDDINLEKYYSPVKSYGRTKLANILFTKELARRLEGTNVSVYCLHPGVVDTELSRHLDYAVFPGMKWIYQRLGWIFMKTPQQGAQTTLHCALDGQAGKESGLYYADCKVTTPSEKACDPKLAKKLWDLSIDMVKLGNYDPFKRG